MAFNLKSASHQVFFFWFFVSVAETSILISTYKTHHTALHSFIIHTCSWCKKKKEKKKATNHEQDRVKLKFSAAKLRKAVSKYKLINSNM